MNKCKISAAAVCFPGARIPSASRYRQGSVSSFPVRSFPERSVSPIPWVGSCRSLPRPTIFALLAVFAGNSSRLPCLTSANLIPVLRPGGLHLCRPRSPDQRGLRPQFARGRVHIHLGNGNAPTRGDCIPARPKGAIGGSPPWRHTVIGCMAPRCRRLPVQDCPPAACVPVVKRAG